MLHRKGGFGEIFLERENTFLVMENSVNHEIVRIGEMQVFSGE